MVHEVTAMNVRSWLPALMLAALVGATAGCGKSNRTIVRVEGSDTMVNVAQAWAERYHKLHPEVSLQVLGGGSGVGIASLIDGNCDLANTSRRMKDAEIKRAEGKRKLHPKEIIVGYDALAVYVHRDNPLDTISLEQLAEIYGDGASITKWSQLTGKPPAAGSDEIVRVGRQNSSGTYAFFREVVLGPKRDFKLGSVDQSGSKDVVALISRTPNAIGYSGMGYHTDEVKMLKVSPRAGEPGIAPTLENAKTDKYPITRPLQIYVLGEPAGQIKEYLDWILSVEGQNVLLDLGYVPVREHHE